MLLFLSFFFSVLKNFIKCETLELYIIKNSSLTGLTGLGSLTNPVNELVVILNSSLTSLEGLEGLSSVNNITIWENPSLISLVGLDNISASSIADIYISNNTSLSTCHVKSICDYLAAPSGSVNISNNAPGCNSPEEVIEACIITVEEITQSESFSIFPNPANDRLTIQLLLEKPEPVRIAILNAAGQQMAFLADDQPKAGEYQSEIDISKWPAGVYLCRVWVGQEIITQKVLKY